MASLLLFACLCLGLVWTAQRLRHGLADLRAYGVGGHDEDLDRARTIRRVFFANSLVFAVLLAAAIFVAERWSPQWRTTPIGVGVLATIALIAGASFLRAYIHSVRQQWSSKGSLKGLMLGMLGGAGALVVLMLTFRWLQP